MKSIALLALIPLAACSGEGKSAEPDGVAASRSYAVAGFSAIESTGPDDVDVRVGSGFSIRAEGDSKQLDKLEIVKNGHTLEVRRKPNSGFSWGSSGKSVKVYITMPRLTEVSGTGSGDLAVDHVDGDSFKGSATGSGNLSIGTLNVQTVSLSLTGSGNLSSGGTAKVGDLAVKGSGDIEAAKLTLGQASVSVMGSGNVSARVSGTAKVNSMGSGNVTLTGGAKCTTSKLGSGEVSCS
jgi:hypothetical protein